MIVAVVIAAVDPVLATLIGGVISAGIGAWAMVRTKTLEVKAANQTAETSQTTAQTANIAASTALLVNALEVRCNSLDAMVSARDSVIEDLRADVAGCEESKRTQAEELAKQAAEIAGLTETVNWMKDQLERRSKER